LVFGGTAASAGLAATVPYVPIRASAILPTLKDLSGCSVMSLNWNGSTVVGSGNIGVHAALEATLVSDGTTGALTPVMNRRGE
jgi:hypothetical protein